MKRLCYSIVIIWLQAFSIGLSAQDLFIETLERANRATPQEAIYLLSAYQQNVPELAAVYFQLGIRYFQLIRTEHPIRDYDEFHRNLSYTRNNFDKCLQLASSQALKTPHYAGLPIMGKKPEYAELVQYIRLRLEDVKKVESQSEKLHQSYCQLVSRYNGCRALYTSFAERYSDETTAHLQLTAADREELMALQAKADSLNQDIEALQAALATFPVEGYTPTFKWTEIQLYRVDGLSYTDLLQNDIALWDYAKWARQFLTSQEQDYTALYDAIDIEYGLLNRALVQWQREGRSKIQPDDSLLIKIDHFAYRSFMRDLMETMQVTISLWQDAKDSLFTGIGEASDGYMAQALDVIAREEHTLAQVHALTEQMQQKLNDPNALTPFKGLLQKWHLANADSLKALGKRLENNAKEAYSSSVRLFAQRITPTLNPFDVYVNEITGAKFTKKTLKFTLEDAIVTVLPVEEHALLVLRNGTCLVCSMDGALLRTLQHEEITDVLTAYKQSSSTIILISADRILRVKV